MPGKIIYSGPSQLDFAPIVVIAVWASSNRKTGDMLQTYILRADQSPINAVQSGADASVCGTCKHRQGQGGACYVTLAHGPMAVWRALRAGSYGQATSHMDRVRLGEGRMVRLGTYGDPMAVPSEVWEQLLQRAAGRTGYSHQWFDAGVSDAQREAIMALCMASADTEAEAEIAQSLGYRTFRVRGAADPMLPGEFACPASEEAGKRKTCAQCGACDGAARGASKASATIVVHGSLARRFAAV